MDVEPSPGKPQRTRLRAVRVASLIAATVLGAAFGLRAFSFWESGSHEHVPTEGLVYMGSILLVAGLMQLPQGLWRRSHDANIGFLRRVRFSRDSPTGRIGGAIQARMVTREERERDSPDRRYGAGIALIAAGATVIVSALLR